MSELRRLTQDPRTTANQVTEVILKEASLATRILHLVNSSFYQRAKPIMTISQAVVQVGMKPLADMCAGLILLQRFVPAARKGGTFANCLQKTILTSLLSGSLSSGGGQTSKTDSKNEKGYLAGSFAELGNLLLAYYFPQIYESAVKRAASKNQEVSTSIREITGVGPKELSICIVDALELPPLYKEILLTASGKPTSSNLSQSDKAEVMQTAQILNAADSISEVVVFSKNKMKLDSVMKDVLEETKMDPKILNSIIGSLPQAFKDHCNMIELNLNALPEFVATYSEDNKDGSIQDSTSKFNQFVEEIKEAIDSREPTSSIITTVMETLAWGLRFDRVLLLLVGQGKKNLFGRMLLGHSENINAKDIVREVNESLLNKAPDVTAFFESKPIYHGTSILPNGIPFVAIPVGKGHRTIGIIYADRFKDKSGGADIDSQEREALLTLAELLDQSISRNG